MLELHFKDDNDFTVTVWLLSAHEKIVHFFDKCMRLCLITTNPVPNCFRYGSQLSETLDSRSAQFWNWWNKNQAKNPIAMKSSNATSNDCHSDREEDWLENRVAGFKLIRIILSASFNIVAVVVYRERSLPWHDCTCHQCNVLCR